MARSSGGAVKAQVNGFLHGFARRKAKAVIGSKETWHEVSVVKVEPGGGRIAEPTEGEGCHLRVQRKIIKTGGVGQGGIRSVGRLLELGQAQTDQLGLKFFSKAVGLGLKAVGVHLGIVIRDQNAAQSASDDSGGGAEQ